MHLVFWSITDLPHCVVKWVWGQEGWTGPIVCWGEGVIGVKRFGLLDGSSPLWMERKERWAGWSQPLGIRVELDWPTPQIRWLLKRAQRVSGPSLWRSGLMDSPKLGMLDTLILFPQITHLLLWRKLCLCHLKNKKLLRWCESKFYNLLWKRINNISQRFPASETLEDAAASAFRYDQPLFKKRL